MGPDNAGARNAGAGITGAGNAGSRNAQPKHPQAPNGMHHKSSTLCSALASPGQPWPASGPSWGVFLSAHAARPHLGEPQLEPLRARFCSRPCDPAFGSRQRSMSLLQCLRMPYIFPRPGQSLSRRIPVRRQCGPPMKRREHGHKPEQALRAMTLAEHIAPHLPNLRRFARLLTGSQRAGDTAVARLLEAIVADASVFPNLPPRIGLYQCFLSAFTTRLEDPAAQAEEIGTTAARSLAALPLQARQAFLLVS